MSKTAIIADDFTGAGDTGVVFARSGLRTALLMRQDALATAFADFDAVALTSESRFMPPREAFVAVRDAAVRCREAGARRFFKKIDSAMRGNCGIETAAVLDALGHCAALVCPAMPSAGRVVRDGMLLLGGKPPQVTSLGRDPFTPVLSGDVRGIMGGKSGMRTGGISRGDIAAGMERLRRRVDELLREGCRALVADAESESDLLALAALIRESHDASPGVPPLLPVGSSGLGRALAGPRRAGCAKPEGRLLAVVGSLDEAALRQAEYACGRGAFVRLEMDVAASGADLRKETARLVKKTEEAGAAHILLQGAVLRPGGEVSPEDGSKAAAAFGAAAAALCRETGFDAVYATGGSTAAAVADALDIRFLVLEGEIAPGVALSSCTAGGTSVRRFVSKAGSFGGPETLAAVAAAFSKESTA